MPALALTLLLPILAAQSPVGVPPAARSEAVVLARVEFRKGNFRETLAKLEEAARANDLVDPADKFEAALLQGLSHVYLGEAKQSDLHFRDVLLANPDFDLDPLTYGEDAKRELDAVRAAPDLKEALERRRDEIRQAKLQEAEIRRLAEEAERRRRELAAIPERVPTVTKHNALLNFLPFGIPQIEQDRVVPGVLFAVAQGVSLTATVLTYTQVHSYIETDGKVSPDNLQDAKNWRIANWVSVGAAAAVYVAGVIDSFVAYKEQSVKMVPREEYLRLRQQEGLAPPASPSPAPAPTPAGAYPKPSASLLVAPLPGGAAVGLVGRF